MEESQVSTNSLFNFCWNCNYNICKRVVDNSMAKRDHPSYRIFCITLYVIKK